jgi:hypothetical protein
MIVALTNFPRTCAYRHWPIQHSRDHQAGLDAVRWTPRLAITLLQDAENCNRILMCNRIDEMQHSYAPKSSFLLACSANHTHAQYHTVKRAEKQARASNTFSARYPDCKHEPHFRCSELWVQRWQISYQWLWQVEVDTPARMRTLVPVVRTPPPWTCLAHSRTLCSALSILFLRMCE